MARLRDHYRTTVIPALQEQFKYANVMQIPKVEKIVLNMGVGAAGQTGGDSKLLDNAIREMATISGQKPVVCRAKKSISNFKLRAGARIGCKVTLRGAIMYEFLDRLITIAIPRIRDFRGLSSKSFDGRGSYSMGVKEQIIFPEIDFDKVDVVRGLDITITTTAGTDAEARALLEQFKFPFRT